MTDSGPAEGAGAAERPGDAADGVTCAECGAVIDTSEWYPVVGRTDDSYEIYHFCGAECRDDWLDRQR